MPISYVSDSKSTIMNGMLTGLYYYYVDSTKITGATYLASCNTIVNVAFNPFLSENDLTQINMVKLITQYQLFIEYEQEQK